MTRISKKKYDAIVKAKNAIADFDLNNRNLEFVDSAVDVIQAVALAKLGALEKTALLAVFTSATLTNNGFRMPPTAAVVSNFKKVSKDVKIPHTQGYVACNTHWSGYFKPAQTLRLGLPLALWFVRIQARCHLCSHNSTWKSFRVAAASGHLTGTAYGQAVKP